MADEIQIEGKKVIHTDNLFFSLADDTVKVLSTSKEGDALIQSCDGAITITSSFLSSSHDLHTSIQDTNAKLEELDRRRISVEENNGSNRQKEKYIVKSKKVLSMCASVTNIVPNLYDEGNISGYILDKNKKRAETFEFENTDFDACNKLWKMLSK